MDIKALAQICNIQLEKLQNEHDANFSAYQGTKVQEEKVNIHHPEIEKIRTLTDPYDIANICFASTNPNYGIMCPLIDSEGQ
ncbi:hypothetical protein, partial [Bacillus thuringiensis]